MSAHTHDIEILYPIRDGVIFDENATVKFLKTLPEYWNYCTPWYLRLLAPEAVVLLPCSLTVEQKETWFRAFEKAGFCRVQIKAAPLSVIPQSCGKSFITLDFIQNLLEVSSVENQKIIEYQTFPAGISGVVEDFFAEKYETHFTKGRRPGRRFGMLLVGKVCGEHSIIDHLPRYENVDWEEIFSVFAAAAVPVVKYIQQLKRRTTQPVSGILIQHEKIPEHLAEYLTKQSGIPFVIAEPQKNPEKRFFDGL